MLITLSSQKSPQTISQYFQRGTLLFRLHTSFTYLYNRDLYPDSCIDLFKGNDSVCWDGYLILSE